MINQLVSKKKKLFSWQCVVVRWYSMPQLFFSLFLNVNFVCETSSSKILQFSRKNSKRWLTLGELCSFVIPPHTVCEKLKFHRHNVTKRPLNATCMRLYPRAFASVCVYASVLKSSQYIHRRKNRTISTSIVWTCMGEQEWERNNECARICVSMWL